MEDKSYIVPHDLAWYKHPTERKRYDCGSHDCAGSYLRGAILHHGRIMITGIGGLNRPPRDPVTGKNTYLTQKVQPAKSWTYLDFKEKKIKWGVELPLARHNHCVVKYNQSSVFIFGGGDIAGETGQGYTRNKYKFMEAYVKELRSGFFMHFPDPSEPEKYVITELSDNGKFPCEENSNRVPTQCGIRANQDTGHKELIVPTYELKKRQPCTAILNMDTFTWRKLARDTRKHINESLISYLLR